ALLTVREGHELVLVEERACRLRPVRVAVAHLVGCRRPVLVHDVETAAPVVVPPCVAAQLAQLFVELLPLLPAPLPERGGILVELLLLAEQRAVPRLAQHPVARGATGEVLEERGERLVRCRGA